MVQSSPRPAPAPLTDSPWFWGLLFSAAGLIVLLVATPKYARRQQRLELQYRARQEIVRRQAEGEAPARAAGEEGNAAPPEPGELIIPLWPLVGLCGGLMVVSSVMLWRSRREVPEAIDGVRARRDA